MAVDQIRVVLVRPKGGANVGATARAMKNMGLGDLALVAPAIVDPGWTRAMATHAVDIVERATVFESLPAAVADCGLVIGTSARRGGYRKDPMTPREAAGEILRAAASNRVALVFGPEDHGLSNDDLLVCNHLIAIPTSDEFASLNLAQAVLVCAYEIHLAAHERRDVSAAAPLAPAEDVQFLLARLRSVLLRIGFLIPDSADHIMQSFRRMLGRAALEHRDVRILLGVLRQFDWYLNQPDRSAGDAVTAEPEAEGGRQSFTRSGANR